MIGGGWWLVSGGRVGSCTTVDGDRVGCCRCCVIGSGRGWYRMVRADSDDY